MRRRSNEVVANGPKFTGEFALTPSEKKSAPGIMHWLVTPGPDPTGCPPLLQGRRRGESDRRRVPPPVFLQSKVAGVWLSRDESPDCARRRHWQGATAVAAI